MRLHHTGRSGFAAAEFTEDVDRVGFSGEPAGRAHLGIEAFTAGEPHQLMRLREGKRPQQQGIHNALNTAALRPTRPIARTRIAMVAKEGLLRRERSV